MFARVQAKWDVKNAESRRRSSRLGPASCLNTRCVLQRTTEPDDPNAHAPLTRLTNAFSKKVENHAYAVALHMMYYNVVRIHQKRVTPAMAAGVTTELWEISDIAKLVEDAEEPSKKSGPYRKSNK